MLALSKNIKILIVLYITSILFLSFLVPPFQSPDEFNHFKRAYLLGEGEIILKKFISLQICILEHPTPKVV